MHLAPTPLQQRRGECSARTRLDERNVLSRRSCRAPGPSAPLQEEQKWA